MPVRVCPAVSLARPVSGEIANPAALIDGVYAVHLAQPMPGAGGGLPAFAATDVTGARHGLMAVQARADAPARAQAIAELSGVAIPGLLTPLTCGPAPSGDGRAALFVICPAPPGPALAADPARIGPPWSEGAIIDLLLRPVAAALAGLETRRITHRAIRPGNLFREPSKGRVVLGCAWAGPPAALQPAVMEPPYSAQCQPAARGDGGIADDIYALGVMMLVMATGRLPLADLDGAAIVQRQLELGSFQALCGGLRLPQLLSDLLGGMLADDPQHRPTPALLADPGAARARRVATRPSRRAAQPLLVEGQPAWNTRMLASAMALHPTPATRMISLGVVDHWLRRHLGDPVMAGKVEDLARGRDASAEAVDPTLLMQAVAVLDPLAPLCWNGLVLWPDAVGALLALDPAPGETLRQMIEAEAPQAWAAMRGEHVDAAAIRMLGRGYRAGLREAGGSSGLARLTYRLNPLLGCRSPMLAHAAVARLTDLLPALEAFAAAPDKTGPPTVDRELVAFLAARQNSLARELLMLGDNAGTPAAALALLRHLAALQSEQTMRPLPRLAKWLATGVAPLLEAWRHRARRAEKQRLLGELADAGDLSALAGLFDDPGGREQDESGFQSALIAAQRIDRALDELRQDATGRAGEARRLGQEIAAALALAALAVRAVAAALG